jgi:hypothetical protein
MTVPSGSMNPKEPSKGACPVEVSLFRASMLTMYVGAVNVKEGPTVPALPLTTPHEFQLLSM